MDTMRTALRTPCRVQFARFLLTLSIILGMLHGASAQGAPDATPVEESSDTPPGSIRLAGWDGMQTFSFDVSSTDGVALESGVITSDHYVSSLLVAPPGSIWSLSLVGDADDRGFSATATAGDDGALHFEVDVSSLVRQRSVPDVSSLATNEIEFTVTVVGLQNVPLQGHIVTVGDGLASTRTDATGKASFSLAPGEYTLTIHPYGRYAGASQVINVSEHNPAVTLTLSWLNGGTLTIRFSKSRQEATVLRVLNGDGILIAQGIMLSGTEYKISGLAYGSNYTIVVAGSNLYRSTIHGPFSFQSRTQVEKIEVIDRNFGHAVFIFTTADGSALPDSVQIELTATDWSASGTATIDGGTGVLLANIRFPSGEFTYEAYAPGFEPIFGSGTVVSNLSVQIRLVLVPVVVPTPMATAVPSPTPTIVPSPTPKTEPTIVPSPTATVFPSPTATVVPSPTPTAIPSPTPTIVPTPTAAPSPTPTPTVVPSPTPTMGPSPMPTNAPYPTATIEPTPLSTAVPTPTPSPSPTAVPTQTPSPSPTAVPTQTPSPSPTAVPTPTPSPSPTAVPTQTPSPSPTAVPTQTPSPSPTAVPTQTPSPSPTAVPTQTPSPSPTAVPTQTPSPSPTAVPTQTPSPSPTAVPTQTPSPSPTAVPTQTPSPSPTAVPTQTPSPSPTAVPTQTPSPSPTAVPTQVPSPTPTTVPTPVPTVVSSPTPTLSPTIEPSTTPVPTMVPSPTPTVVPLQVPTTVPSPTRTVVPPPPAIEPTRVATVMPTTFPEPTEPATDLLPGDINFDGVISTTVLIRTPGDSSLEGSPYELYAPVASQAMIQPYRSGLVGPDNTIQLDDLPAARYRLVVLLDNGGSVDMTLESTVADVYLVWVVEALPPNSDTGPRIPSGSGHGEANQIVTDGTSGAMSVAGTSDRVVPVTGLPDTGVVDASPWNRALSIVTIFAVLLFVATVAVTVTNRSPKI